MHECPNFVPDTFYSTNLQIVIARLLEKNPQNRPSSDELLRLIPENACEPIETPFDEKADTSNQSSRMVVRSQMHKRNTSNNHYSVKDPANQKYLDNE